MGSSQPNPGAGSLAVSDHRRDYRGGLELQDAQNLPVTAGDVNALLPRRHNDAGISGYRPSGLNWAILQGEAQTGVTIQRMVRNMDAGDIILQRATPIGETEDAASLYDRLAPAG